LHEETVNWSTLVRVFSVYEPKTEVNFVVFNSLKLENLTGFKSC